MEISTRKIDRLMAQKELGTVKLSELSGISRQSISTIKQRGTCQPLTAAKLAKGLGVDVTEILEDAK